MSNSTLYVYAACINTYTMCPHYMLQTAYINDTLDESMATQ
jgi:hypothetical protein